MLAFTLFPQLTLLGKGKDSKDSAPLLFSKGQLKKKSIHSKGSALGSVLCLFTCSGIWSFLSVVISTMIELTC